MAEMTRHMCFYHEGVDCLTNIKCSREGCTLAGVSLSESIKIDGTRMHGEVSFPINYPSPSLRHAQPDSEECE